MDVLIIGAGAAGLGAARELSAATHKVTMLEARDRIGGRAFTLKEPASPVPIELGAEFVHGKSPALFHLTERARLKLMRTSDRHWYFEDGKLSRSHEFWQQIEKLNAEMKARDADQSLKEFLASLPDDEDTRRLKQMLTRYVEGFHAANTERIGIRGIVKTNEAANSIDGGKSFRFLDGYDSLMQSLWAEAENYGATLHLNTIVKEIHWNERARRPTSKDGVSLICEHKNQRLSFAAARAIITLPLGVLQSASVQFIPDLPDETRTAIKELASGNVLRIVLRFRERFWEQLKFWDEDAEAVEFADAGFIHYPDARIPTWWTQLPLRAPILVGWAGGPRAERILSAKSAADSVILDHALASLSLIFKVSPDEIRDQLEASYSHDWHHDPFSRGAYSYVPVNGLAAQEILSKPIDDLLFFAGEATSIGHIGTVHGAVQSGQRAAGEILALSS